MNKSITEGMKRRKQIIEYAIKEKIMQKQQENTM